MRLAATASSATAPEDLYAVAADLRNLPAWWIEHLSAEVETPAARLRDAIYSVRYRLPWGLVIDATCTVVAARPGRSLTYLWDGGGMRLAVGQDFEALEEGGSTMRLVADLAVTRALVPLSPVMLRVMRRRLSGELDRALSTLDELASARTAMGRGPQRSGARSFGQGGPAARVLRGGGAAG